MLATRTWPYGTRKKVEVIGIESGALVCAALDGGREGYVLFGRGNALADVGDTGEIVFCEGGPMGGYWKYEGRQ